MFFTFSSEDSKLTFFFVYFVCPRVNHIFPAPRAVLFVPKLKGKLEASLVKQVLLKV